MENITSFSTPPSAEVSKSVLKGCSIELAAAAKVKETAMPKEMSTRVFRKSLFVELRIGMGSSQFF